MRTRTVFFSVNTLVMQQYWAALPAGAITVVDINAPVTDPTDPFAAAKVGYQTHHRRHCRRAGPECGGPGDTCHRGPLLYRRGPRILCGV